MIDHVEIKVAPVRVFIRFYKSFNAVGTSWSSGVDDLNYWLHIGCMTLYVSLDRARKVSTWKESFRTVFNSDKLNLRIDFHTNQIFFGWTDVRSDSEMLLVSIGPFNVYFHKFWR